MAQEFYETLKVDRKASSDEIRKSYRRLARKCHPDPNPGDKAPTPERGTAREYALNIDFWQAIRGTQTRLAIPHQEVCETCHGAKSAPNGGSVTCPQCEGTGSVSQMAGSMKFNLTCPRCSGTGQLQSVCPTCHGDGRVL